MEPYIKSLKKKLATWQINVGQKIRRYFFMTNNRTITSTTVVKQTFKVNYPLIYKNVISINRVYDGYLIAELNNNTFIRFDSIRGTIRYFNSLEKANSSIEPMNPKTEKEWKTLFAKKLYRRMQAYGYSVKDLSEEVGIGTGTISRYINGNTMPNVFNILKIAKALKCSVEYLIKL